MATLDSYTTLVAQEVDDTSSDAESLIQQYVKEVYQDFMTEASRYLVGSLSATQTAVVGTANYTPADCTEVLAVYYMPTTSTSYSRLTPISEEEYLDRHINDANGTPTKFYVKGTSVPTVKSVNLVPAPSDAGTIKFVTLSTTPELAAGVTSIIPDKYTDVIKYGGAYKYKAYDGDPATPEYKMFYEEAKRKAILELATSYIVPKPSLYA